MTLQFGQLSLQMLNVFKLPNNRFIPSFHHIVQIFQVRVVLLVLKFPGLFTCCFQHLEIDFLHCRYQFSTIPCRRAFWLTTVLKNFLQLDFGQGCPLYKYRFTGILLIGYQNLNINECLSYLESPRNTSLARIL